LYDFVSKPKKEVNEMMNKKEGSLNPRAIGELLAEIYISAEDARQKIKDFFSALPHQQKVLIEVPFLIRLLQRGEKESALTMMLEITEIKRVTESEAVAIALKGGLIARGPGMLVAYQGANPAIRKLFHLIRKEVG
jgi:hypothetical protein